MIGCPLADGSKGGKSSASLGPNTRTARWCRLPSAEGPSGLVGLRTAMEILCTCRTSCPGWSGCAQPTLCTHGHDGFFAAACGPPFCDEGIASCSLGRPRFRHSVLAAASFIVFSFSPFSFLLSVILYHRFVLLHLLLLLLPSLCVVLPLFLFLLFPYFFFLVLFLLCLPSLFSLFLFACLLVASAVCSCSHWFHFRLLPCFDFSGSLSSSVSSSSVSRLHLQN